MEKHLHTRILKVSGEMGTRWTKYEADMLLEISEEKGKEYLANLLKTKRWHAVEVSRIRRLWANCRTV